MGLLRGLMGDASETDLQDVEKELEQFVIDQEQIEQVYKLVRDLIVFSNYRLILIDKQGVTGKKTEYYSIPYQSISHFSVETAGHFDLDAELLIWISHAQEPIVREFRKDKNIYEVQRTLASHVFA